MALIVCATLQSVVSSTTTRASDTLSVTATASSVPSGDGCADVTRVLAGNDSPASVPRAVALKLTTSPHPAEAYTVSTPTGLPVDRPTYRRVPSCEGATALVRRPLIGNAVKLPSPGLYRKEANGVLTLPHTVTTNPSGITAPRKLLSTGTSPVLAVTVRLPSARSQRRMPLPST
ncbi:hypothetical protein D3C86_943210 [compost metagenome]